MRKFSDDFSDFVLIGALILGSILMMRACDIAEEAVKFHFHAKTELKVKTSTVVTD